MNITAITPNYYQNKPYNYYSKPSFNGVFLNAKTIGKCNIGKMPDGIIGKVKVKNLENKDGFFDVQKYVEYAGLEHYAIQDKRGNILGEIEFMPVKTNESKHIWVEHLVSHSSLYHKYKDEYLGDYKGIGTRLMQIAYKRSLESGCEGNIELFSTNNAIDFYKKLGMKDYLSNYSKYQQHRMYLPEEGKSFLSDKYGGL